MHSSSKNVRRVEWFSPENILRKAEYCPQQHCFLDILSKEEIVQLRKALPCGYCILEDEEVSPEEHRITLAWGEESLRKPYAYSNYRSKEDMVNHENRIYDMTLEQNTRFDEFRRNTGKFQKVPILMPCNAGFYGVVYRPFHRGDIWRKEKEWNNLLRPFDDDQFFKTRDIDCPQ